MHPKSFVRGALCVSLLAVSVAGGVASAAPDVLASRPTTLNGTDIDNDDAVNPSDTGPNTTSPSTTPITTVPDQSPSWWERVVGWIWS